MTTPIAILCCYARKDQHLWQELKAHLIPLQREGLISIWADTDIDAGTEWEQEIHVRLAAAQIILLLISPDFISSEYCYNREMKQAMERHERGEALVIPVILRPVYWQRAPFGKLQALPTSALPITRWENRDEAFYDVSQGLRTFIEEWRTPRSGVSVPLDAKIPPRRTSNNLRQSTLYNPYRGLAPFKEQDAPYFFGRERFVQQLFDALHHNPLIAVIGATGSGKSSTIFAGLLPRLHKEEKWFTSSFRLGNRPFHSLAVALNLLLEREMSETDRLIEINKLAQQLQQKSLDLLDVIDYLVKKNADKRFLLYLDQFEELYTLTQEISMRQRFLDGFLGAVQALSDNGIPRFNFVLTLRADFFSSALDYRPFADVLQQANLVLGPMNREELSDVIKRPAAQFRIRIEKGLTERLLKEVSQQPSHLPLLEFTLAVLWEKQRGGQLTHAAYDEIGGVEKAVADHAEEIYARLSEDEKVRVRQIFMQLIRPGDGTEDTRRLATRGEIGESNWELTQRLISARLVVSEWDKTMHEETVEMIHETLIRGWQRLHSWLNEDRAFRLWQERLRNIVRHWEEKEKDPGLLLRGMALIEAVNHLIHQSEYVSISEQAFIRASQQHEVQELQNMKLLERSIEEARAAREEVEQQLKHQQRVAQLLSGISSGIASQASLSSILSSILLAMQELADSKHCAVLLIDAEDKIVATHTPQENADTGDLLAISSQGMSVVMIVAQQGLYKGAEDWHPSVSDRLLLGKILHNRQALVVPDTSAMPEIEFPSLDNNGSPLRPGSAVSVPILETQPEGIPGAILGTIEIYHQHAHSQSNEEVELLEQFAPQAGLAIQNARIFQRIKHLARVARQQAHQMENVMRVIPDGVIIYDAEWRLLEMNHSARRLLGWSDHDIGLPISQAIARSKARFAQNSPQISALIADLEQHQQTQDRLVDEFEMVGADGQTYTMRRSKAPIREENGHTFAYVVFYHDVTEQAAARRQVESEVRARTEELAQRNVDLQEAQSVLRLYTDHLRLMLERLPAGVMLISLESQQVGLMNSQASQLLQRIGVRLPTPSASGSLSPQSLPDATGMKIEELLQDIVMYDAAGAVVPYEEQPFYQALHRLETSEAELSAMQPDGQVLRLLINAAPLSASDGTIINIVLVWQDITWIIERARKEYFHRRGVRTENATG